MARSSSKSRKRQPKKQSKKQSDWRNALFSVVVAVLLSFLIFTSIEAFYPTPQYDDFCDRQPYKPYEEKNETQLIAEQEAYDECSDAYTQARQVHGFVVFVAASLIGLIAIILSIYLPLKNDFSLTLANGLLLGGLIILFFGTIMNWDSIATEIRPFVLLIELVVVIIAARKKIGK